MLYPHGTALSLLTSNMQRPEFNAAELLQPLQRTAPLRGQAPHSKDTAPAKKPPRWGILGDTHCHKQACTCTGTTRDSIHHSLHCSLVVFSTTFILSHSLPKSSGKTLIPQVHLQSWGSGPLHSPWANSGTFMGTQELWRHQVKANQAEELEGMVKSSPGEVSAAQEPNPSSSPTRAWQADACFQPATFYQLMKSTLGQTSAPRALQVPQISDLPKTRHGIYSLGLMLLSRM